MIRQCNFSELASTNQMQALKYLHTSLASIVDHNNPKEEREVKTLRSYYIMLSFDPYEALQHSKMKIYTLSMLSTVSEIEYGPLT